MFTYGFDISCYQTPKEVRRSIEIDSYSRDEARKEAENQLESEEIITGEF
jgi:hypothetical protein